MNKDYWNKKRFLFLGQRLISQSVSRIGVCNFCRAIVNFDTKRTVLHHEYYDKQDPLKHTIELCTSCHNRVGWEQGLYHDRNDSDYWRKIGAKGIYTRWHNNRVVEK